METTENEIPKYAINFFTKLRNYLDTKLYFFGSVQRKDYFPSNSDIDVAIFTDNMQSTLTRLQAFLGIKKHEIKRFAWRLNYDNQLVIGYKIMYKEPEKNFITELSIYNEKFKHGILEEHNGKKELPFYATILLIILKTLFYTLHIIPSEWYIYCKNIILTTLICKKEDDFVVLDLKQESNN
jgi:predicted nucleotidyltransferase